MPLEPGTVTEASVLLIQGSIQLRDQLSTFTAAVMIEVVQMVDGINVFGIDILLYKIVLVVHLPEENSIGQRGKVAGHPEGGPEQMVEHQLHMYQTCFKLTGCQIKVGSNDRTVYRVGMYVTGYVMSDRVQVVSLHHDAVPVSFNLCMADTGLADPLTYVGVTGAVKDKMCHKTGKVSKGSFLVRLACKDCECMVKKDLHGFPVDLNPVLVDLVLAKRIVVEEDIRSVNADIIIVFTGVYDFLQLMGQEMLYLLTVGIMCISSGHNTLLFNSILP